MSRSALASAPSLVVEIARHRVSAASIIVKDGELSLGAHAVEPLSPGLVNPSLNSPNIPDQRAVVEALQRAVEKVGVRPKRIALAIPDSIAKVSLLRFENVPQRPEDLNELVKWQVRKAAPFRVEDAQLSYTQGLQAADGSTEFVVVMARKDIIEEYEEICTAVGGHAGVVDLASFNVINAVLASGEPPSGDWLLVRVAQEEATMAILRGSNLVFFRNRAADGEASLADMVHQTAMYYEDRLSGSGFSRVLITGAGDAHGASDAEYLRKTLEQRLATRVDQVDARHSASLTNRIAVNSELLDSLAPLVGLIARDRAA